MKLIGIINELDKQLRKELIKEDITQTAAYDEAGRSIPAAEAALAGPATSRKSASRYAPKSQQEIEQAKQARQARQAEDYVDFKFSKENNMVVPVYDENEEKPIFMIDLNNPVKSFQAAIPKIISSLNFVSEKDEEDTMDFLYNFRNALVNSSNLLKGAHQKKDAGALKKVLASMNAFLKDREIVIVNRRLTLKRLQ